MICIFSVDKTAALCPQMAACPPAKYVALMYTAKSLVSFSISGCMHLSLQCTISFTWISVFDLYQSDADILSNWIYRSVVVPSAASTLNYDSGAVLILICGARIQVVLVGSPQSLQTAFYFVLCIRVIAKLCKKSRQGCFAAIVTH
jgi:hypothetical protein